MRLNHPDYIKLLKATYHQKRRNNELQPLLAQSTPASIRKECINVCKERFLDKDVPVLRAFFGPAEDRRHFLQLIENFETDKFKPLDNFLKGATGKTEEKNLHLLAWLIDFPHRPFEFGKEVLLTEEEKKLIGDPEPGHESTESGQPLARMGVVQESDKKTKRRVAALLLLFLLLGLSGFYFIRQAGRSSDWRYGNAPGECMYWSGDRYVPVSCNDSTAGRLLLPLRLSKIEGFKRITREDTITERSIGVVHYLKVNDYPEFYTTEGYHPVQVTRRLRPLSEYMYDKYLLKYRASR